MSAVGERCAPADGVESGTWHWLELRFSGFRFPCRWLGNAWQDLNGEAMGPNKSKHQFRYLGPVQPFDATSGSGLESEVKQLREALARCVRYLTRLCATKRIARHSAAALAGEESRALLHFRTPSRPHVVDVGIVGPVDGMNERSDKGPYFRLVTMLDDDKFVQLISRGAAEDLAHSILGNLAASVPTAQPGLQVADPFPYQKTFNAIAAAVEWREHRMFGISVQKFVEAFGVLAAPVSPDGVSEIAEGAARVCEARAADHRHSATTCKPEDSYGCLDAAAEAEACASEIRDFAARQDRDRDRGDG